MQRLNPKFDIGDQVEIDRSAQGHYNMESEVVTIDSVTITKDAQGNYNYDYIVFKKEDGNRLMFNYKEEYLRKHFPHSTYVSKPLFEIKCECGVDASKAGMQHSHYCPKGMK
jgi:hypothetical protein